MYPKIDLSVFEENENVNSVHFNVRVEKAENGFIVFISAYNQPEKRFVFAGGIEEVEVKMQELGLGSIFNFQTI